MATSLFELEPLLPALEAGEPILTANDRLRRHLLKAWDQHQRARGLRAWEAPEVLPLNRWLDRLWQQLLERGHEGCDRALAGRHQRQWVWEQVIGASDEARALLQPDPLARQADQALRNLTLWEIDRAELADDAFLNTNTRSFLGWCERFEARLASRRLLTPEAAHRVVAEAFEAGALPRTERLWLLGFDQIPPLHRRILKAAAAESREVDPAGAPDTRLIRTGAPDREAELRAAARWSLTQIEADPEAVIGIIVPDLGQRRTQVERVFAEVFEPTADLPDRPRYTLPFNFSAGQPLGNAPPIRAALELLGLLRDQWPLDRLCELLHNPFWGEPDSELALRGQLVQQLRDIGEFEVPGSRLRGLAERLGDRFAPVETPDETPALPRRLQRVEEARRRLPASASARHWARAFQTHLDELGWPGPRRLDSQEYQQVGQWYELLETFAGLEATGADLGLSQALEQLARLARQTPFQAQTPDSPVQILGALEGAGLRFSHCWVVGLDQRQWPPAPAPNPLLPLALQRDQQMPQATAERELQIARSLTDQYRRCAGQVVLSSPRGDDQGEIPPSPLIRELPETPLETLLGKTLDARERFRRALAQARSLEPVASGRGPAVPAGQVRGGAGLFKAQAACPFNAFARYRLGARRPEPPALGLTPAQRGTLVHRALASFWRGIENSEALAALSEEDLQALVAEICQTEMDYLRYPGYQLRHRQYLALERERLQALIERWLDLEKQRPPFVVEAIEQRRTVRFDGRELSLTIDRIDRLENDERLLIDYKTGASLNVRQWDGERPDEPQLPLYAISDKDPVSGIAFAQLHPASVQWIGLGALSTPPRGIQPDEDWDGRHAEWSEVMTRLAREFFAGEAPVAFKDRKAGQYDGDLEPLNRLPERETLARFLSAERQ